MPHQDPHDRIFEIIYSKADEITWQGILYELVKTEQMDPWEIDISLIAHKYLETIRKLKEHDFRVSGKMVLAASILLKLKSTRLVGEDITELDRLISGANEDDEDELVEDGPLIPKLDEIPTLYQERRSLEKEKYRSMIW